MSNLHFVIQSNPSTQIPDNVDELLDNFLKNPPYQLSLSLQKLFAGRNQCSSHVQNAFFLFRKDYIAKVGKRSTSELAAEVKESWKRQPKKVRQYFEVLYYACRKRQEN